ncbi:DUF4399 domain-containing protein [Stappia sp. F7233]|uniref:DUF4399 domain-containing protein n=1 Tax=Stappia albiluteola TaxID=2758565 RepID=A0A839AFZ7_9HYPH|nr:DUF4399 domain-containing protein [Stappia albiluteola]MBA5778581.1 DUF4399 domain-containing protein [Stappia albiluteola]
MKLIAMAAIVSATLAVAGSSLSFAGETPAPEGARVYFIDLKDGDTVKSPLTIRFGLEGMGVAPAGVDKDHTGHHHLLVDTVLEGEALNEPLPADEHHHHFGGGQTEVTVELSPGTHTLQLIIGDHNHIPHDPPIMSERITVTVE